MTTKQTALSVLVLLLFALPAQADLVITTSGGRLKGEIVKETRREVHLKKSGGVVVKIPRNEIDRIERQDLKASFKERRKATRSSDTKGMVDLAAWAKDNGLEKEAKGCYEKVLESDYDNAAARRGLGYKKVKGKWLRGEALHKALGHVQYDGKWVTPEERDKRQNAKARRKARASTVKASARKSKKPGKKKQTSSGKSLAKKTIVLPEEDASLLSIVRGSSGLERRVEAVRTLANKGGDAREMLRRELNKMLAKANKKLVEHFKNGKGKIRAKLGHRIIERRKSALAIIFDKSKYPDANHGAAGQPLVDAEVGRLYQAYSDPLRELATGETVSKLLGKVTQLTGWLRDYCRVPIKDAEVIGKSSRKIAKIIAMEKVPLGKDDAKILRESQGIVRYNKAIKTSLNEEERACIVATNEYRMLFGLRALRAHEPAIQAARKHSIEMNRLGFFDHNSPTPANRTPAMRMQREGARYAGENIAMGQRSGRAAFNAWYTSSGHHRNMLAKTHRSIGLGQDGKYWTQDFGYDNPEG